MSDKSAWLAERRKGIGGSDCASVLGLSRYGTPLGVYLSKRGESTPIEETEPMRWGTLLEPVIRQRYSDLTGREVRIPSEILCHPKYDYMLANVDGLTADKRILEVKTAKFGQDWGEEGTDQIPIEYMCQVQHYMIVTGFVIADVAVLIGGSDFRLYEVEADKELQELIIDREADFWEMVKAGTPPDPVSYADAVKRFKTSVAKSVMASSDIETEVANLRLIKAEMSRLEKAEEEAKAQIMIAMADNDTLVAPDGSVLCTWKESKSSERFDPKTFKAAHPDLYSQFTKAGEPSRRFLIKGER